MTAAEAYADVARMIRERWGENGLAHSVMVYCDAQATPQPVDAGPPVVADAEPVAAVEGEDAT